MTEIICPGCGATMRLIATVVRVPPLDRDYSIRTEALAAMVRAKRGNHTLEEAAKESGISAGTLSRIERNKGQPLLDTLNILLHWLK